MIAIIIIANILLTIIVYFIVSRIIYQNRYAALKYADKSLKESELKLKEINEEYIKEKEELTSLLQKKEYTLQETENLSKALNEFKEITSSAKEEYFCTLEQQYENDTAALEIEQEKQKKQYANDIEELRQQKNSLENAITARIAAAQREKQIQAKKEDYMISCSLEDKRDIAELNELKKKLSKPRILSMLIWQTYYQKPLKSLSVNILGTSSKTGIYKITNQNNGMCYIGQAVDIAARWCEHVKCGCGIDTPAGNKLYTAMQEEGIYNFTFELLEECPRALLNEKEKEYISLYQSKDFGYNTLAGITKHN